ncbi:MAG: acyl-CoA dehydrogenase family protein [Saprospiraceae bacterium]|nr:acyl-CoA dehydrogenase family protein [Saprospiraceae bacterium]
MNFTWPQDYLDYQQEVIAFAQKHLNDDVITRDQNSEFAEAMWQKCADFGIQGLAAPKAYGGRFDDVKLTRAILAMQGLGYGCEDNGLALALNAHMWAVTMTITKFGNEAQKQKYLPKLVDGSWIGCHGLTEKGSGSDVFNMHTTAVKQGDKYILNGEKIYLSLAPISDLSVVFAVTNPDLGKWGVSTFIVEKDFPGFHATPNQEKMGLRTAPFGSIRFENCEVPAENLVGNEGAGLSISNHSLQYDRCCIMSSHLGAMERQIEESVAFAKTREQFGQKIGNFQAISHRIAEMKLRLETSKLLLYKLAWLLENDRPAMMESALLKLQLSETAVANSLDLIRIHGGKGYVTEFGIERHLRDAVGGVIYAGTSDIQKNIIAKLLGV